MSYQRYTYSNQHYSISLYREGALANSSTRSIRLWGDSPLIIERDPRGAMESRWGTRCELHIVSDTHYAYEHIVLDDREWKMEVSVAGIKVFTGRVERGLYEESYDTLPYEVIITASCGLKSLDDYRLDIDTLPRTSMQLTSLWEIIKGCLKLTGTSEVYAAGDISPWLTSGHINPNDYLTDEDGLLSTKMAGDVLDGILSSLGLICYHSGIKWVLESVSVRSEQQPIILETKEHRLEGNPPSLQTDAAIGSLRINLPTEVGDTIYPLASPTIPLPECHYTQDYFSTHLSPLLKLSASSKLCKQAKLPTSLERAKGMQVRLPYVAEEAISVTIPYLPPQGATRIRVGVELGFDGLSSDLEEEIQAVCEIKICNNQTPLFVSSIGNVCYFGVEHVDPKHMRKMGLAQGEERETVYPIITGGGKDGVATFKSVWAITPKNAMTYNAYEQTNINAYTTSHLPYSKVKKRDLKRGKLARFNFVSDLPYPQMVEIHEQRRRERGISYKADMTHLSIYIPMRFWGYVGDTSTPFSPSEVMVGRIYFSYEFEGKEDENTFVIADRGNSYLRMGEPIDLVYTTEIPGLQLPYNLKGQLRTADNKTIQTLGGRTNAEWVAAAYFATMGITHDTVTLKTNTPSPYPVNTLFQLRNRPNHTYRLMGLRYDAKQGTSELTLSDTPMTLDTTTYDL